MTPLGALLWTAACHAVFQLAVYAISATRPLDVRLVPLLASWLAAALLLVLWVRLANNPGARRARAEDRA